MSFIVDAIFGGGTKGAKEAAQITAAESARNRTDTREAIQLLQQSKLINAGGITTRLGQPAARLGQPAAAPRPTVGIGGRSGVIRGGGSLAPVQAATTTGGPLTVTPGGERTGLTDLLAAIIAQTGQRLGGLEIPSLTEIDLGDLDLTTQFPELGESPLFPQFDSNLLLPRFDSDLRLPGVESDLALPGFESDLALPGFGDDVAFPDFPGNIFTSSRRNLEDTRRRVTGDLRENLARRRISGSSFASDALSRADREFERQGLEIDAEESSQRLEFEERKAAFQTAQEAARLSAGERGVGFQAEQEAARLSAGERGVRFQREQDVARQAADERAVKFQQEQEARKQSAAERGVNFQAEQQKLALESGERGAQFRADQLQALFNANRDSASFENAQQIAESLFNFDKGIQNRNDLFRELDVRAQLIERESNFSRASIETLLNELNIETQIALELTGIANNGIAGLTASTNSALAALAQTQAGIQFKAGVARDETLGSLFESGASLKAASIVAACWVAREVYGIDNPRWLLFRQWLFSDAPNWFFNIYIEFGERFASYIKNKPLVKNIIRYFMDKKIQEVSHG